VLDIDISLACDSDVFQLPLSPVVAEMPPKPLLECKAAGAALSLDLEAAMKPPPKWDGQNPYNFAVLAGAVGAAASSSNQDAIPNKKA
jgi:hypothetical protein